MVPVVSAKSGKWVLPGACAPMMKPGGHGAIWKLMLDRGVFSWLSSLDCEAALVRQIRQVFGIIVWQNVISAEGPLLDPLL